MNEILEITDERLARIQRFAKRTLSKDEVFAFSNKSAGDMMIPGRNTRLSPELLQQFVKDAQFGVSFMFNHSWSQFSSKGVPYGKVFDGRTQPDTENGETISMSLDKYIIRDDEAVDGVSANALIKRIETGVLSDTSIGWGTDTMVCSICGMNYYGGKCSHWKGATYEMVDGSQKKCTVLAMPSSVILQNSNTNLYEESIVWDGAYPGATLSNDGDIIENPNGKFMVIEDYKNLNPGTVVLGQYYNGKLTTMVKKSDNKNVFSGGISIDSSLPNIQKDFVIPPGTVESLKKTIKEINNLGKGDENKMDPKVIEMFAKLGVAFTEGETMLDEALKQVAEKFDLTVQTIKESAAPLSQFMTVEQVSEKLGKELSAEDVLKLAKEGQDFHKFVADEAIAMGVRAMGNDFPKETWENTFASMSTESIKDITKTWETQAKATIPTGRHTDPAGNESFSKDVPDEAFKVKK